MPASAVVAASLAQELEHENKLGCINHADALAEGKLPARSVKIRAPNPWEELSSQSGGTSVALLGIIAHSRKARRCCWSRRSQQ
jgi:hypothetical protein